MVAPLAVYLLLGLGLFYLQNLVLYPYVQLRLLSLLTLAVARRQPLAVALGVAIGLGLLQDAYALTPMGLRLAGALFLVSVVRFLSRRLLLADAGTQMLVGALVLMLEEVFLRLVMALVGLPPFPWPGLGRLMALEVMATALLAPLMFAWLTRLDGLLRRRGWQSLKEQW